MSSWTVTLCQEASELNTNFILYTFRALYFLMQLFISRKDKAPELLSGLYLTTLFTQLILLKTLNECLENNRALRHRGKISQGWENTMYLLLRSIVLLFFFFLVNLLTTKTKKSRKLPFLSLTTTLKKVHYYICFWDSAYNYIITD